LISNNAHKTVALRISQLYITSNTRFGMDLCRFEYSLWHESYQRW